MPHNDQIINLRRYKIIIIYTPNIGVSQYIRQMLTTIKGEIDSDTIIVGDFNTSLTPKERSYGQIIIRRRRRRKCKP